MSDSKTHTSPVRKTYAKVVWDIADVMDGYDVTVEKSPRIFRETKSFTGHND